MEELVRKCRAFIGQSATTIAQPYGSTAANTWPVPSWAPKGSRWVPRLTNPMLLGPDGHEVAINWVAGTAQKPAAARKPVTK